MVAVEEARTRITDALRPYEEKLRVEKDGTGIVSEVLYHLGSQPSHHMALLVSEAVAEFRDGNMTDDALSAVVAKYVGKAERLAEELRPVE